MRTLKLKKLPANLKSSVPLKGNRAIKLFSLLLLFLTFFTNANTLFSQAKLSEDATISLLTCAPGAELYALFGHSAVRVKDPAKRYDKAFNYGIFDFDTPNFMVKFVRGKLLYKLGVQDMRRFDYSYKQDKRPYVEQVFNLNQEQKNKVFNYLLNNARPENREYKYDFFFDNCASRIRDVLQESLGDEVDIPTALPNTTYPSYRSFLDFYLYGNHVLGEHPDQHTWTDFGMDLILGIPADQEANLSGQMYLPEFLAENLSQGKIGGTALLENWSAKAKKSTPTLPTPWYFPTPFKVFTILFLMMLGLFFSNKNKLSRVLYGILFLLLGLSGWLFLFMWFGTDHEACHQNMNMLWMNPLHLFLGIQLLRNKVSDLWKKYMGIALTLNLLVLVGWKFLPQEFHFASIPIILTSCLGLIYFLKKEKIAQV